METIYGPLIFLVMILAITVNPYRSESTDPYHIEHEPNKNFAKLFPPAKEKAVNIGWTSKLAHPTDNYANELTYCSGGYFGKKEDSNHLYLITSGDCIPDDARNLPTIINYSTGYYTVGKLNTKIDTFGSNFAVIDLGEIKNNTTFAPTDDNNSGEKVCIINYKGETLCGENTKTKIGYFIKTSQDNPDNLSAVVFKQEDGNKIPLGVLNNKYMKDYTKYTSAKEVFDKTGIKPLMEQNLTLRLGLNKDLKTD